jgi:hypothetical protein
MWLATILRAAPAIFYEATARFVLHLPSHQRFAHLLGKSDGQKEVVH